MITKNLRPSEDVIRRLIDSSLEKGKSLRCAAFIRELSHLSEMESTRHSNPNPDPLES